MNLIEKIINNISERDLWDNTKDYSRNDFITTKGKIDTNLYFIESGSTRIFVIDENKENTIRFGYQNNIIVSLDSFITEKPSDLYIQALKKTTVKKIKKKAFLLFLNSIPEFKNVWANILEDLIVQQLEREKDLLTSSPIHRYKRVLKRSPQLFQEIPDKYIADYLRMTPETFSRIKKS